LCVDEKSKTLALDRTAPYCPAARHPARITHDYVRNDTTSLFAVLKVASGSVIAQHYRRHCHQEFLRLFKGRTQSGGAGEGGQGQLLRAAGYGPITW